MSLSNLGLGLSELGQPEHALAAIEEALDTLWPFFERIPAAFGGDIEEALSQAQELHKALRKPLPPLLLERLATFLRLTKP
jgi:hypothetical protein